MVLEEPDTPYFCIQQASCRLCQYGFEEGDAVFATAGERLMSPEFSLFRNGIFHDYRFLGVKFHMSCREGCRHPGCLRGNKSYCFHAECFDFRLYEVSPKLLATTAHSFRSPILGERQRKHRTVSVLAQRLHAAWLTTLPIELCRMVARFLVRECATITAEELAKEDGEINSVLDLSLDVYVRYIMIDGIRYVKSLRNPTLTDPQPGELLLHGAQDGLDLCDIHIGEDHLGIRVLQSPLLSSKTFGSDPRMTGVWWREISRRCGRQLFKTKYDGLKLRDLVDDTSESMETSARIYWPLPAPSVTIIDLGSLRRPLSETYGLRMSFFECNAARTTGYSVATDGMRTAAIQTHSHGSDISFYEEVDRSFGREMWIYMPIDEGEYVSEIYRRFGFKNVSSESLGFMFATNRGRTTLFGCHLPPPSSEFKYQIDRVCAPPSSSSRIYYNESDSIPARNEIKFLGLEHPQSPVPSSYPESLVPISPCPWTTYNEVWFYSSCSMEDVAEITLCVNITVNHKPVIGMLLRYCNNRRVCVGQFRLDWAQRPIRVTKAQKLNIGMNRTEKGFAYVADVTLHSLIDRSSIAWLEVSWDGTLIWYFSRRQCILRYRGREAKYCHETRKLVII